MQAGPTKVGHSKSNPIPSTPGQGQAVFPPIFSSCLVAFRVIGRDVVVQDHQQEDRHSQHVGKNGQLNVGDHVDGSEN